METTKLKNLIKEAIREVLKEELANLGKQKRQNDASCQTFLAQKFNSTLVAPKSWSKSLIRNELI